MWRSIVPLVALGILPLGGCPARTEPPPRVARTGNADVDACNDGSAAACYRIGVQWAAAKTHRRSKAESWKHFKMACEGGYAPGCIRLRDLDQVACFVGLAKGCWNLGQIYRLGKKGIPVDLIKARSYYFAACRDGIPRACYELAMLWQQGGGGPLSRRKARALFRKACRAGHEEACVRLPERRRRR